MTERKSLASTIKKDQQDKASKKEELASEIIKQHNKGSEKLSKITVMVPEELHEKIKLEAVKRKTKIRDLIIDFIKSL